MATVKNLVKKFLIDKGNYEELDDSLIDRIPFILEVIKEAQKEIKDNGVIVYDHRQNSKRNPAIDVYKQWTEKLERLFLSLGLTPRERTKLKLQILEQDDGFDD